MIIRSTKQENTSVIDQKKKYPWIGQHKTTKVIVLFEDESTGTIINTGSAGEQNLGYHSVYWTEFEFSPYYGTISINSIGE
jgi:hypothetical protein